MMLDTNVLSDLRRGGRPELKAWMAGLQMDVCVSAVTVAELQFGAADVASRNAEFARELEGWLDQIVATTRVVAMEAAAGRVLGRMQAVSALRHLGAMPPKDPRFGSDLAVAATAVAAGCPIATLNLRDFHLIAQHFPVLVVVDPLASR